MSEKARVVVLVASLVVALWTGTNIAVFMAVKRRTAATLVLITGLVVLLFFGRLLFGSPL